jgi:hypothetical protein
VINVCRILSWLALVGTMAPAVLLFYGRMTHDQTRLWMLIATVVWFATAPVWMERQQSE